MERLDVVVMVCIIKLRFNFKEMVNLFCLFLVKFFERIKILFGLGISVRIIDVMRKEVINCIFILMNL